ncbi:MAG TPA: ATP-binding protein [Roseateles sp.]
MTLPSLQARLNRAVLATTLSALLLSAAALLGFEALTVRNGLVEDLSTQADLMARSVAAALAFDDPRTAQENIELLRQRPRIRAAQIVAGDGHRVAGFGPPPDAAGLLATLPHHRFDGTHLRVAYPVMQDGTVLGWVVLEAEHDLWARLLRYAEIEAVVMAVSLTLGFVVFGRLQRSITRPLLHVGGIAAAATSRRDWSLRAGETGDNADVSALVASFNRMLEEMQRSTQELQREMEERGRAEAALREADRIKDEFLATLGHELRNPLAPMVNAAALMRARAGDARVAGQALDILERQLRHLTKLIDDLLDVSRITTGKLRLANEPVDLTQLAHSVAAAVAPLAEQHGLAFKVALPEHPCFVDGDPVRLAQVLNNLLNNAMRYTPAGGQVALRLQCEDEHVQLQVQDSGIGVPDVLQQRIFELFAQGDQRLERGNTGLGIGLTLARQIVRLHGGELRLFSEGADRGACFTVELPHGDPGPEPATALPVPAPVSATRGRVLIADDNVDYAVTLAALLEAHGCATEVVHDGEAALAALRERPPRMAVLDIGMPGLNGYAVARQAKADPASAGVRLVAVTGWGQAADRRAAIEAGFDHHLVKPASSDAILALLDPIPADPATP